MQICECRLVPLEGREVHQHRPARVRHVCRVDAAIDAAGELPEQPCIDRPEREFRGIAIDLVEDQRSFKALE